MNVDAISVALRRRLPQEANDLGVALVREHAPAVYGPTLFVFLPFLVGGCVIAAATHSFWLVALGVWWLKPLFERPTLHALGRALYTSPPSTWETAGATLRSWRTLRILAELTIRRVLPFRAFEVPVWELEGLSGATARRRAVHLSKGESGRYLGLLSVFSMVALLFFVAGWFTLGMVLPETIEVSVIDEVEFLFDGEPSGWFAAFSVALYGLTVLTLHPIFSGVVFSRYVDRRIDLEGWDIEVVFRHLRNRLLSLALVVCSLSIVGIRPASAARPGEVMHKPPDLVAPTVDPQAVIGEILAAPEFGRVVTETRWVPRTSSARTTVDTGWFATLFEIVAWVVALCGALWLVLVILRHGRRTGPLVSEDSSEAAAIVHVEDDADPTFRLPPRLLEVARRRWEEGARTEAMSLLYRGLIEHLIVHYDLAIGDDATAREIVRTVQSTGGPADYVRRLGGAWTSLVYARRPISDADARDLFDEWERRFGGRS